MFNLKNTQELKKKITRVETAPFHISSIKVLPEPCPIIVCSTDLHSILFWKWDSKSSTAVLPSSDSLVHSSQSHKMNPSFSFDNLDALHQPHLVSVPCQPCSLQSSSLSQCGEYYAVAAPSANQIIVYHIRVPKNDRYSSRKVSVKVEGVYQPPYGGVRFCTIYCMINATPRQMESNPSYSKYQMLHRAFSKLPQPSTPQREGTSPRKDDLCTHAIFSIGDAGCVIFWMSGPDILKQILFSSQVDHFLMMRVVPIKSKVQYRSLKKLLEEDQKEQEEQSKRQQQPNLSSGPAPDVFRNNRTAFFGLPSTGSSPSLQSSTPPLSPQLSFETLDPSPPNSPKSSRVLTSPKTPRTPASPKTTPKTPTSPKSAPRAPKQSSRKSKRASLLSNFQKTNQPSNNSPSNSAADSTQLHLRSPRIENGTYINTELSFGDSSEKLISHSGGDETAKTTRERKGTDTEFWSRLLASPKLKERRRRGGGRECVTLFSFDSCNAGLLLIHFSSILRIILHTLLFFFYSSFLKYFSFN